MRIMYAVSAAVAAVTAFYALCACTFCVDGWTAFWLFCLSVVSGTGAVLFFTLAATPKHSSEQP